MKNKPFIKLLKTPRSFYLFDVNKDTMVEISQDTFDYLDAGTKIPPSSITESEIRALQESGFLSSYRVETIRHPETDNIHYLLSNYMSQLILQVTQACNLCCIYCPYANSTDGKLQRKHSSKTMNFEIARKAIDYFAACSGKTDDVVVSFYGGEPLLAFPLIKQCVEYCNSLFVGRNLSYVMTTNATLFTDEMIEFIAKNKFVIAFSMDGPKEIHDKNRTRNDGSGTYDVVIRQLKNMLDVMPDSENRISINMVIDPKDDFDLITEWLMDPMFKRVVISTNIVDTNNLEKEFEASDEFKEKYNYHMALSIMDYMQMVDGLVYSPIVSFDIGKAKKEYFSLKNEAISLPNIGAPGGPCVPGVHKLFVTTDGKFYPCEKVNENSKAMEIGSIECGIDEVQVEKQLNISTLTATKCQRCWAFRHCSVCQLYADGQGELSAEQKNSHCSSVEKTFLDCLKICLLIQEGRTLYRHNNI